MSIKPDPRRPVTGISKTLARAECQGDQISEILTKETPFATQIENLDSYFKRCAQDISNPWDRNPFLPLISFSAIKYVISENPHVRLAKITMPSGRVVRGMIGLKPDDRPRPLILVKCGVFCDAQESSNVVSALMHLFDESPFHVLILGNITGSQFEHENKSFAVGGFDEGRQLYQIAAFLKQESPFKERISSIQTLGVSLGGHAALYSALYSSENMLTENQRAIDASMAICPVVSLENSLQRLYNHDLLSHGYTLITFRTLLSFADRMPFLKEALQKIDKKNPHEFYDLLTTASLKYYQNWTRATPWDLQPFSGVQVNDTPQFWRLNNFTTYDSLIRIPTLVIAAENDDIVRYQENAALLKGKNTLLQVLPVPHGGHCAFSTANGYERWSRLLQDYFISNDPIWKLQRRSLTVDLSHELYGRGYFRSFRPPIFSEQVQAEWKIESHRPEATLILKFLDPTLGTEGGSCLGVVATDADESSEGQACLGQFRVKVPLQKILEALQESRPENSFAAQRLTRLLNTRSILVDKDFKNYLRSDADRPVYLKIDGFE